MLQRKPEKLGRRLGKTTGWIHRATLAMKNVQMIGGVSYDSIDSDGLNITFGGEPAKSDKIVAETVVLCVGQKSERGLADVLLPKHAAIHVIGGADVASELDAKRAIDQGVRLAASI